MVFQILFFNSFIIFQLLTLKNTYMYYKKARKPSTQLVLIVIFYFLAYMVRDANVCTQFCIIGCVHTFAFKYLTYTDDTDLLIINFVYKKTLRLFVRNVCNLI